MEFECFNPRMNERLQYLHEARPYEAAIYETDHPEHRVEDSGDFQYARNQNLLSHAHYASLPQYDTSNNVFGRKNVMFSESVLEMLSDKMQYLPERTMKGSILYSRGRSSKSFHASSKPADRTQVLPVSSTESIATIVSLKYSSTKRNNEAITHPYAPAATTSTP